MHTEIDSSNEDWIFRAEPSESDSSDAEIWKKHKINIKIKVK